MRDSVASAPTHWLIDDGPAAPPRKNGELVFDAPWESRVFGMAVALFDQTGEDWALFSTRLAEAIAALEPGTGLSTVLPVAADADSRYYTAWLAALESVLVERGLVTRHDMDATAEAFESEDAHRH